MDRLIDGRWRRFLDFLDPAKQRVLFAAPRGRALVEELARYAAFQELASKACELFTDQPGAEQRRLLQVVVERAAWQEGVLRTTLFEPFEILRRSNQESSRKEKEVAGSGQDSAIWLPGMDSNHDSRLQRPLSYH
jgi:hypothetical protein